ncbi:MAG: DUF2179 domain-containing protein [archaeon]
MILETFLSSDLYAWVILPILIFLARIVDVSIGTVRLIFISKGMKRIAPVLGFFEVLIWLTAVRQIIVNMPNVVGFIAYAGGFATGTYVGMIIEEKLAKGKVIMRVITKSDATILEETLRLNYKVTHMDAKGPDGPVKLIFMVIERNKVPEAMRIIKKFNPRAFYSIEDVRTAREDFIPTITTKRSSRKFKFPFIRKGK